MILDSIRDRLHEDAVLITGHDNAVIGFCGRTGRVIYSLKKVIKNLMQEEKVSYHEAIDIFEFHILNAYVGDMTPILCYDE